MTDQELFDKTVRHLHRQGHRSVDDVRGECAYRGDDGDMCAAGVHISDEHYRVELESQPVEVVKATEVLGRRQAADLVYVDTASERSYAIIFSEGKSGRNEFGYFRMYVLPDEEVALPQVTLENYKSLRIGDIVRGHEGVTTSKLTVEHIFENVTLMDGEFYSRHEVFIHVIMPNNNKLAFRVRLAADQKDYEREALFIVQRQIEILKGATPGRVQVTASTAHELKVGDEVMVCRTSGASEQHFSLREIEEHIVHVNGEKSWVQAVYLGLQDLKDLSMHRLELDCPLYQVWKVQEENP